MLTKPLLALVLSAFLAQASFALELNGIGTYEQLRKEFYIGALYLSELSSDPATIQASTTSKRMAIRVTTKRWSPRRWSLQWQNDIAINNAFDDDPEFTDQVMFFTGFLKDNLIIGDEIIIDYIASVGTVISINGIKIIETQSDKLFKNLLNVWIGKLPPSGEFKKDILKLDDRTKGRFIHDYKKVGYDESRTQVITSWVKSTADALLVEQNQDESSDEKAAEIAAAKQAEKQKALELAKAAELRKQKQKEANLAKAIAIQQQIAQRNALREKQQRESTASAKAKDKKEAAAENKYYLDLYTWELTQEIQNAVVYPVWAKKFGQKGTVTLSFTVDRNTQVTNIKGDNPEASELLIAELERAITATAPLVLPPDDLTGDRWKMSVSYVFDPRSGAQKSVSKPDKPKSLLSTDTISTAQYNVILNKYTDSVVSLINMNIEYPVWAKDLNQRGKVALEVVINKDGSFDSINDVTLSRHNILNQALRQAIEKSEPLPIIPEPLQLNTTRVTIEHNFK